MKANDCRFMKTALGFSISTKIKGLGLGFALMLCIGAAAQDRLVQGKVTSAEDNSPIPGVNILSMGKAVGTVSDVDGIYSLQVPTSTSSLVFSFIGFKTIEVELGERSILDVSLEVDITQLSEVVVTGTGVPTEKRKLAFAVESVTTDKLPIVPTASIDQALVGRIPGAQISSISGTPGSEMSIVLRGINTINSGTMPMILVDGVQMGATLLSSIDPNSIEKVEVIQGAAAATIYGAQGANGVLQIFTKKGKSGQIKIDFSMGFANNKMLNVGGVRKAQLHGFTTNYKNEVTVAGDTSTLLMLDPATLLYNSNIGYDPLNPSVKFDKPYDQNLQYFDHFKTFFVPANTYNTSIAVSGGSDKTDFNVSLSKTRQESTFNGSGYNDRTNLSLNLGIELARSLHLRTITRLINNKNTINVEEKQDFGTGIIFGSILYARPFADYNRKDMEGNYGADYGEASSLLQFNPNYQWQYSSTLDNKIDILQSFNLTYSFPKYLDLDLLYGINYQDRNLRHEVQNQSLNQNSVNAFTWSYWNNDVDNTGEITTNYNNQTFQNLKTTAFLRFDFEKDFNLKIPIKATTQLSYDYRSDASKKYENYALGMPVAPPLTSIQGTTFGVYQDYKERFVTFGYLINQRFEYGDLAGVSGGFRSDYSSAFGKGSKPFTFPRADGFFRLSGLDFWNNSGISNAILEWKVRAAYGEAGIQPRPFDRYVTLGSRALGATNALYIPADQSNANLNVEVSKEFEVGTDIMFEGLKGDWLRNFQTSISYWTRTTENAIFRVDAAPSTGVGTLLDNAISLESKGLQVSLNASMFKGSKVTWNLTTNYSQQNSIISKVKGDEIIVGNRILKAGEPVGQLYGWLMLNSVDQKNPNGEPFIDPSQQSNFTVASNGWVVNKSSKQPYITPDRYGLGNPNPDFMMTFINDISYRNFLTFSFQVDWLQGNHLMNYTKQWMYRDGVHSDYEKPITINGETGAWSAFYRGVYNNTYWDKNYFVEDASFVRLRNVSIGLDFAKLFTIQKINRLQLVLSGRNLWTITKYTGMDPEISSYGANTNYSSRNSLFRGIDNGTMPNFRTYQFTFFISL